MKKRRWDWGGWQDFIKLPGNGCSEQTVEDHPGSA